MTELSPKDEAIEEIEIEKKGAIYVGVIAIIVYILMKFFHILLGYHIFPLLILILAAGFYHACDLAIKVIKLKL